MQTVSTSDVGNCLASLFCVVAQIHTGAGCTREVTLKAWGREEDDGFDVRCTGMAESTLMQEQRFQLLGHPIGQQQGIIFGDVPPFMRPRPGTRIARDAAGETVVRLRQPSAVISSTWTPIHRTA
jgi:hypothetical protein